MPPHACRGRGALRRVHGPDPEPSATPPAYPAAQPQSPALQRPSRPSRAHRSASAEQHEREERGRDGDEEGRRVARPAARVQCRRRTSRASPRCCCARVETPTKRFHGHGNAVSVDAEVAEAASSRRRPRPRPPWSRREGDALPGCPGSMAEASAAPPKPALGPAFINIYKK